MAAPEVNAVQTFSIIATNNAGQKVPALTGFVDPLVANAYLARAREVAGNSFVQFDVLPDAEPSFTQAGRFDQFFPPDYASVKRAPVARSIEWSQNEKGNVVWVALSSRGKAVNAGGFQSAPSSDVTAQVAREFLKLNPNNGNPKGGVEEKSNEDFFDPESGHSLTLTTRKAKDLQVGDMMSSGEGLVLTVARVDIQEGKVHMSSVAQLQNSKRSSTFDLNDDIEVFDLEGLQRPTALERTARVTASGPALRRSASPVKKAGRPATAAAKKVDYDMPTTTAKLDEIVEKATEMREALSSVLVLPADIAENFPIDTPKSDLPGEAETPVTVSDAELQAGNESASKPSATEVESRLREIEKMSDEVGPLISRYKELSKIDVGFRHDDPAPIGDGDTIKFRVALEEPTGPRRFGSKKGVVLKSSEAGISTLVEGEPTVVAWNEVKELIRNGHTFKVGPQQTARLAKAEATSGLLAYVANHPPVIERRIAALESLPAGKAEQLPLDPGEAVKVIRPPRVALPEREVREIPRPAAQAQIELEAAIKRTKAMETQLDRFMSTYGHKTPMLDGVRKELEGQLKTIDGLSRETLQFRRDGDHGWTVDSKEIQSFRKIQYRDHEGETAVVKQGRIIGIADGDVSVEVVSGEVVQVAYSDITGVKPIAKDIEASTFQEFPESITKGMAKQKDVVDSVSRRLRSYDKLPSGAKSGAVVETDGALALDF